MPTYVCEECGEAFDSKDAYRAHGHEESTARSYVPDISPREIVAWFTLKKAAVLFGVLLMGTLFMGTAFFYSSFGGGGGSTGTSTPTETEPPSGRSITDPSQLPQVSDSALPRRPVSTEPLSRDVQIALLVGQATGEPAILLQYGCENCPETVQTLEEIAQRFNGPDQTWVFVAPYPDMEATVAMTAFQQVRKLDEADRAEIERFICDRLRATARTPPITCIAEGS